MINMRRKKNKKKKILKVLIVLLIIGGIVSYIFLMRVKNIYVSGNILLTDQEIIELAGLENYPKLFKTSSYSMENKIKVNSYIEDVKVSKDIFGSITIKVKEYNLLLKNELDNTMYLSNLKTLPSDNNVVGIPTLINSVDKKILESFLKKLDTIDRTILSQISEVKYEPNQYDKDLFLFYMTDGNYVYITTTRLNNINKYDEALKVLEGKKGILYLDSGNHFQVLE